MKKITRVNIAALSGIEISLHQMSNDGGLPAASIIFQWINEVESLGLENNRYYTNKCLVDCAIKDFRDPWVTDQISKFINYFRFEENSNGKH